MVAERPVIMGAVEDEEVEDEEVEAAEITLGKLELCH